MTLDSIETALGRLRAGELAILVDDHDGSGEGELIGAAESATAATMSFMVRFSSGFIRVAMPPHRAAQLQLPPMVSGYESSPRQYTVTVDAAEGITTGISAHDRALTVRLLVAEDTTESMLRRPGHTVPICGPTGGMLTAPGRVQAALDLVAVGRRPSAAYFGTIVSEQSPTLMATGAELGQFAARHGLAMVTVTQVDDYLRERFATSNTGESRELLTPSRGPAPAFFQEGPGSRAHLALRFGPPPANSSTSLAVVRECPWDRLFGPAYCDCAQRRDEAIEDLQREGGGVLIYLRNLGSAPRARLVRPGSAPDRAVSGWSCAQDRAGSDLSDTELDAIQSLRFELGIDQFGPVRYAAGRNPARAARMARFAEPLHGVTRAAI
jgi:3,4-dihydroxy 2-butanone 4-phosphate synthase/GTP cyclohydrolase II